MKSTVLLILSSIFLLGCGIRQLEKKGFYKEVPPTDFLNYINDSSIYLIDVRTNSEYEKTHIKNAVNINFLGGNFLPELKAKNWDPNTTTLIYCETQHRSLFVAKKLFKTGFKNIMI